MEHLRGHTPETLAAAFRGLSLPVARRVVHRLVGEDRDQLDGVPGLSNVLRRELQERGRLTRLEVVDRRRSERRPVRQVPVPGGGRPSVRGRAHPAREAALQRVRLVAGRLRARLRVLRDGPARLPAQPRAVGDGRAGAHDPPRVDGAPDDGCRVPGPGRAAPELRRGDAGRRACCAIRAARASAADRITISTVGLLPQIERYVEERQPYRLILSLTSAFSEKRERLVPVDRPLRGRGAGRRRCAGSRPRAAAPCSSPGC